MTDESWRLNFGNKLFIPDLVKSVLVCWPFCKLTTGRIKVDLDAIYSTGSGELDLESRSRDGCFDYDELYIVWEPADIQATIDRLQVCKTVAATFSDLLIPYRSPDGRLFSLPTPLLNLAKE